MAEKSSAVQQSADPQEAENPRPAITRGVAAPSKKTSLEANTAAKSKKRNEIFQSLKVSLQKILIKG